MFRIRVVKMKNENFVINIIYDLQNMLMIIGL